MSAAGTAIEPDALARDTAALVAVPSVTGSELAVLERLGELPARLGLDAELREHDLAALRAHPDHPGEEGPWWRRCTRWQPARGRNRGEVVLHAVASEEDGGLGTFAALERDARSYGADMRLFCECGIPCVMCGTPGLELAHAVDERVAVDDLVRLSRTIARVIEGFGAD